MEKAAVKIIGIPKKKSTSFFFFFLNQEESRLLFVVDTKANIALVIGWQSRPIEARRLVLRSPWSMAATVKKKNPAPTPRPTPRTLGVGLSVRFV